MYRIRKKLNTLSRNYQKALKSSKKGPIRLRQNYAKRVAAVKRKWRAELDTIASRYLSMETNEEIG
jgi:hypothetical protein